jgi:electron transfer flavoprotein alpha/beta subunit
MALTIISLIKQVPLPSEMRMGEDGLMERTKAKSIINNDCQFGLEAGLQLKKQNPDEKLSPWVMTKLICCLTESLAEAILMPQV